MSRTKHFVVDTNTLISSLLIKNSTSFKSLEKVRQWGSLIFSNETFLEFETVLFRKKFDKFFSEQERLQIIERTYKEARFVDVNENTSYCRDPKDDKFLHLAIDGDASCIITGDNDLLILHPFKDIPILSSADFLNQFTAI